jgi:hypothetical protein
MDQCCQRIWAFFRISTHVWYIIGKRAMRQIRRYEFLGHSRVTGSLKSRFVENFPSVSPLLVPNRGSPNVIDVSLNMLSLCLSLLPLRFNFHPFEIVEKPPCLEDHQYCNSLPANVFWWILTFVHGDHLRPPNGGNFITFSFAYFSGQTSAVAEPYAVVSFPDPRIMGITTLFQSGGSTEKRVGGHPFELCERWPFAVTSRTTHGYDITVGCWRNMKTSQLREASSNITRVQLTKKWK